MARPLRPVTSATLSVTPVFFRTEAARLCGEKGTPRVGK